MKRWLVWVVIVFAMHFVWEMVQAKWYVSMQGLSFWTATALCLRAAVMDVLISLAAFGAAAAVAGSMSWPRRIRPLPVFVFLMTGLAITIAIELFALWSGRWRYDELMPQILGVGIAPLLQWVAIPWAALSLFRRVFRR